VFRQGSDTFLVLEFGLKSAAVARRTEVSMEQALPTVKFFLSFLLNENPIRLRVLASKQQAEKVSIP
jgi:hypothetical protein